MIRIDGVDEIKAAALLFQRADAGTRKAIREEAARWAPDLVRAAVQNAREPVQRRIAESGQITVTTKGLIARFGSRGRVSGAELRELAGAYEFGSSRQNVKKRYIGRQRTSKRYYPVERRTKAQLPRQAPDGHFIYPAVAEQTPELVARWVRAIGEVVTGGR